MRKNFTSKKHIRLNTTAMGASNDLVKKYDDIIDLSLGDVDFKTPELVIRKAMEDALLGHTHYTDFLGDIELRKEIKKFYKKNYNINLKLEEIMVTTSGCHGMWLVLESILDDDDEVIIHEPYFTPYSYQIMLARGKPIFLPTYEEENFEISPRRLEKLITEKTKAVIINAALCDIEGAVKTLFSLIFLITFMMLFEAITLPILHPVMA
jgi:aspartate/methionine/tyrosine aminotransferase